MADRDGANADNRFITFINGAAVIFAYLMLGLSLWLSTDVPLATKGFWAMSVVLLTLALVNFVKYRFDARLRAQTEPHPRAPALRTEGPKAADKAA